jgi:protein-serine/threonine kinase
VSAPNTKAFFNQGQAADAPAVPPLPPKDKIPAPVSPRIIVGNEIDLNTFEDPSDADSTRNTSPALTPFPSASSPSLPYRALNTPHSPLNPSGLSATGTRGARSLTVSAAGTSNGSKARDAGASLGVGLPKESHHKAVFRRTYSSNSIKTRSVEVTPSSFQKIKLLGKGDVGKVYLVREKKTDKLFAMKGGSLPRICLLVGSDRT